MLKHSQGFTPRAIVSIALPLSVGTESGCELLDFELEGQVPPCTEISDILNQTLPAGIRVTSVWEADRKIKEITYLKADLILEYDNGVPADAVSVLDAMLKQDTLTVVKHSRKGDTETDVRPLLKEYEILCRDDHTLVVEVLVCAQNPSLNPQLLADAMESYCPHVKADFSYVVRREIFDKDSKIFR